MQKLIINSEPVKYPRRKGFLVKVGFIPLNRGAARFRETFIPWAPGDGHLASDVAEAMWTILNTAARKDNWKCQWATANQLVEQYGDPVLCEVFKTLDWPANDSWTPVWMMDIDPDTIQLYWVDEVGDLYPAHFQ